MTPEKSNIVLIGMAGCGKTTIGRLLAQKLNRQFVDVDDLIVESQGKPLQEIIDTKGPIGFRQIEERILLEVKVRDHVIATGGSSIYSAAGMKHLKEKGIVILLMASLDVLKERVGDTAERGLVKQPDQSFDDLYIERRPLYEKYSEITVECSYLGYQDVCRKIIDRLI